MEYTKAESRKKKKQQKETATASLGQKKTKHYLLYRESLLLLEVN